MSELRILLGLTQADLADKLRCTPRYVAQIEAGRNVTLHTIARLASALNATPIELFQAPTTLQRRARGRPPKIHD